MESSLDNKMLLAIKAENLNLVSELLSKGANPNNTVSTGMTCLGEAIVRGLTDIAKLLVAESHSDKHVNMKNRENKASFTPLKTKIDMSSKDTTERAGKQTLCKSSYKLGHGFGSSSEDSKVQSSKSDLEWDENIGKVAANTKEDDMVEDMYQWYATILETTGAAMALNFINGIDHEDSFGETALSYACDKNNLEIFKALIEAGCKIDTPRMTTGWTVLHSACKNERLQFIEVLLAAGFDVNKMTLDNTTALHIAVCNSLETTTMLVDHGANLELRDDGERTALFLAAKLGKSDIVQFLISRGARFNVEDWQGHTPLCLAVRFDHINTASMLLQSGARIKHFQCMLHYTVKEGRYHMTELLANHGHGLNIHNFVGDTPLLIAMETEHPVPFVRLLLSKGANVNACNSISGSSALHVAVESHMDAKEFEGVLNSLLDHSNNIIDRRSSTGVTALNQAILLRRDQFAVLLIRYGADVNIYDLSRFVYGSNLIRVINRRKKLADMLIKAGHNNVGPSYVRMGLANICRIRIRNMRNGKNLRDFVRDLPIPKLMKNFLMMEDFVC